MKNILKITLVLLLSLILCACGNKKEVKTENNLIEGREKLIDKTVVPKKLNFNFNIDGMKILNLYRKDENNYNLEIPIPDYNISKTIFNDFTITKSGYGGVETSFGWYINNNNGSKFEITGSLEGLSGVLSNTPVSDITEDFKNFAPGEGGESIFFRKHYNSSLSSFINRNTRVTDGGGNGGISEYLNSATLINDTYSASIMSFRYGTNPRKYTGNSLQGYKKAVRIEQQITDYLKFNLNIIYGYSEWTNKYDVATVLSDEKTREIESEQYIDDIFERILKMYGCYNQYLDVLENGTEFKEDFENFSRN